MIEYCRSKEAFKWLSDGDIIQNLESEEFYKEENGTILTSLDCVQWRPFNKPMVVFPPYVEWRSISNFHYYNDLKKTNPDSLLYYLTNQEELLNEDHSLADKDRKRWLVNIPLEIDDFGE
jgi:hypothetical protein